MATDMNHKDVVRGVVARFFDVPEADVTDTYAFPAGRMASSFARTSLYSAIKRASGLDLAAVRTANSFGELFHESPLSRGPDRSPAGDPPLEQAATSSGSTLAPFRILVGVDLEEVDKFPVSDNPWQEDFYLENYSEQEVAYAQRQPNPRQTLCGMWCAKESVMKLGGDFARLRPKEILVTHHLAGRPEITLPVRAPGGRIDLSISHTDQYAMAVCVTVEAAPFPFAGSQPPIKGPGIRGKVDATLIGPHSPSGGVSNLTLLALIMGALSMLIACVALLQRR